MSEEEIRLVKEKQRQENQVLKAELQSLKSGRKVYASNQCGNVFFEVKQLSKLKSELEKKL